MHQLEKFEKFNSLVCGISEKKDGNMSFRHGEKTEVLKNRKNFLDQLEIDPDACVNMSLDHSSEVAVVQSGHKGKGMKGKGGISADALVTNEKNLFLFLLTADCLPIIFYDPEREVVSLCHVGWRGVEVRIIKKVIETFTGKYESKPGNIIAAMGPAVYKESYKFPSPFQRELPGWENFLKSSPDGLISVDFVGYARKQMIEVGISEGNIEESGIDTARSHNFFSHYRSARTGEPEGRFATVAGMRK